MVFHAFCVVVKGPTEGALDSRFMSLAVSLGAQKTSLLQTDLVAFQPDEFIQKLVNPCLYFIYHTFCMSISCQFSTIQSIFSGVYFVTGYFYGRKCNV